MARLATDETGWSNWCYGDSPNETFDGNNFSSSTTLKLGFEIADGVTSAIKNMVVWLRRLILIKLGGRRWWCWPSEWGAVKEVVIGSRSTVQVPHYIGDLRFPAGDAMDVTQLEADQIVFVNSYPKRSMWRIDFCKFALK